MKMSTAFLLRAGFDAGAAAGVAEEDAAGGGGEARSGGGGDVCERGRYCVAGFAGFVGEEGRDTLPGSGFAGSLVVVSEGFFVGDVLELRPATVLIECVWLLIGDMVEPPPRPPNFRCIIDPDGRATCLTGAFAVVGGGESLRSGFAGRAAAAGGGGGDASSFFSSSDSESESVMYAARS